jgi:hypothetical protein
MTLQDYEDQNEIKYIENLYLGLSELDKCSVMLLAEQLSGKTSVELNQLYETTKIKRSDDE